MVDREQTLALEHRVGLSILLAEWVTFDAMMLQELFRLHPRGGLSNGSWNRVHSVFLSRSHSICLNRFGVPPQSQAVDASGRFPVDLTTNRILSPGHGWLLILWMHFRSWGRQSGADWSEAPGLAGTLPHATWPRGRPGMRRGPFTSKRIKPKV